MIFVFIRSTGNPGDKQSDGCFLIGHFGYQRAATHKNLFANCFNFIRKRIIQKSFYVKQRFPAQSFKNFS
jgi:hypothetical protein